uniref:GC-rich sequence DNA-binding factor 2 n=1 Tax=Pavo cristatus TaxID=9049 RepID=A0A8C9FM99_PAVCR
MFRRPPRNFRGRQRAASSGSGCSSDDERGSASTPPLGRDPDKEVESEESEGGRGGAAVLSSEGVRTAVEQPLPSAEPARGTGAVLSFGSEEEEREGIPQLEPGTGNTKGARETKEESCSSLSEGYNSTGSENDSNPSQRRKDSSPGCVAAAQRRRHLARPRADFLPLDVSNDQLSRRGESSDDEDESDMNDLPFVPRMRALRHRMAEHMVPVSDESSEDEAETKWEELQIKKAVRLPQEADSDAALCRSHPAKPRFSPCASLPPVDLGAVKKQLTERMAALQDVHRAHQREYGKYMEDIESSKMAVQELEKSSDAAVTYKFYRAMKTYVENLVSCFNEKLKYIDELESAAHALLQQRALSVLKRRQEELEVESTYMQHLTTGNGKPTNDGLESDEKMKLLEMCEHRRAGRRQLRERSQEAGHHEGVSSDEELTAAELAEFQRSRDNILEESRKIFEDVHEDFCDIRRILLKFQEWKEKFPDSYCDAYIGFCLPKLLNPLIRVQLMNWSPLEKSTDLEEMPWFRAVEEFSDARKPSESKRDDDPDEEVLPRVIEKTILPKITAFVRDVWDPLSTSQTESLTQLCSKVFEKQALSSSECSRAKQDLINAAVLRMRQSVEEDVFIPLYPEGAVEDKSSPRSKFQERRFWSAVKLLSNVLLWDGVVQEDAVRDLGLGKLLNRYLLLNLFGTPPGPENIEKCKEVVACFPQRWFQNLGSGSTLPELLNFCQHLVRCARVLHSNNHRDGTEEVVLLLVRVKALRIAEELIEECKLEHLKSAIRK